MNWEPEYTCSCSCRHSGLLLEAQDKLIASLVSERDSLILQRDELLGQVAE